MAGGGAGLQPSGAGTEPPPDAAKGGPTLAVQLVEGAGDLAAGGLDLDLQVAGVRQADGDVAGDRGHADVAGAGRAQLRLPRVSLMFFALSGLCEGSAYLLMWRALAIGEVSVVSPLVNSHSIVAIALAAILRPSLWIVALVIAMVNWVWIARVIYSVVLTTSQREFVEAAHALGVPTTRIIRKHLLPHLVPTLLVWGTLGISTTVMFEASLSFLGVGVRPPTPSWGGTISESQSFFLEAPWLVAFPGASILLTSLAFNLVGDALRDALDPQLRSV